MHLSPCSTRPINIGLSVRLVSTSPARRRTRKKVKTPVVKAKEVVVKWKTLQHGGVLFPPLYVPHGVNILYQGEPVFLPPEAEEVATFFAALLETDHASNPVFVKNFFSSFKKVLARCPPTHPKIVYFKDCDFSPIHRHLQAEKAAKELSSADKKAIREERERIEEPYRTCVLDGKVEKVGNFRIEPPGLFRGRGEHPKTGLLKTRIQPEQVTINLGKDATVPSPPPGHQWGKVVNNQRVTWLATWKENASNLSKYVWLAPESSIKTKSDLEKYEKARNLQEHIDRIRTAYTLELSHPEPRIRQRATALYLIDRFALRPGTDKADDEAADTVGCCSLRVEHVTLTSPATVAFDFLGKDSVQYLNTVEVSPQVFENLRSFKESPSKDGDLLFGLITVPVLNHYLAGFMDGLSAKVFRTYNASSTFSEQLGETPNDPSASVTDKISVYKKANRMVAVLCNHQKSVSKTHDVATETIQEKIRVLKYQRRNLRTQLFGLLSPAQRKHKKYDEYRDDDSELDDDWIERYERESVAVKRGNITKQFERGNLRLKKAGEKPLRMSVLKVALDEFDKILAKEKKGGSKATKYASVEEIVEEIEKLDVKIWAQERKTMDMDEDKAISLGTSRINYLDPRITYAWCKKHDVPVERLFSKTLEAKFGPWASGVDADWKF